MLLPSVLLHNHLGSQWKQAEYFTLNLMCILEYRTINSTLVTSLLEITLKVDTVSVLTVCLNMFESLPFIAGLLCNSTTIFHRSFPSLQKGSIFFFYSFHLPPCQVPFIGQFKLSSASLSSGSPYYFHSLNTIRFSLQGRKRK